MSESTGHAEHTGPAGHAEHVGQVEHQARRARHAADALAVATRATKDAALQSIADALVARTPEILAANEQDLQAGRDADLGSAVLDRLALSEQRVAAAADAVRQVAALADPVGEVVRGTVLPNGLRLRQLRVPLGVVGIVYEGRPNVTVDATGLCLKSGNAALLRGSSSAAHSNAALVAVLRDAVAAAGLPADAVQQVDAGSRDSVKTLMRARGLVDVLIPRGGGALIQSVIQESTVPVIETGVGNCHVYVDAGADQDMALSVLLNAKTHRPSVCNAAESLLVHEAVADTFLPRALAALRDAGVTVYGDARVRRYDDTLAPATEEDLAAEYLTMTMSAAVVDSLDDAVDHIARYGTGHTEAIVTDSVQAAERFTARVDAAAVMVNASTRFTDGEEFGFGGEIGISTQKLHARGPMGLSELTSTKYVVTGDGHIR